MIKNYSDKKITAKQKAGDILYLKIQDAIEYFDEMDTDIDGMTEKEKEATRDQLKKYVNRMNKMLGFTNRWDV